MDSNSSYINKNFKKGAVTFLDVLGWKGIWKSNDKALYNLIKFIKFIEEKIALYNNNYNEMNKSISLKNDNISTIVKSISDTIVLFTEARGDDKEVIRLHSDYCSFIIEQALKLEIPLRGAISFGEYDNNSNIMIGPAVDEAAAWHESTDWIGVILSPSAQMVLRAEDTGSVITYDKIPFKKHISGLKQCVWWDYNESELFKLFIQKGPHMQDVAPKYLQTIEFIKNKKKIMNKNKQLFFMNEKKRQ